VGLGVVDEAPAHRRLGRRGRQPRRGARGARRARRRARADRGRYVGAALPGVGTLGHGGARVRVRVVGVRQLLTGLVLVQGRAAPAGLAGGGETVGKAHGYLRLLERRPLASASLCGLLGSPVRTPTISPASVVASCWTAVLSWWSGSLTITGLP